MPTPLKEITRVNRDAKDCIMNGLCFVCRQPIAWPTYRVYAGLDILVHDGACQTHAHRASEGYYQRTTTKTAVLTRLYRLRSQEEG